MIGQLSVFTGMQELDQYETCKYAVRL